MAVCHEIHHGLPAGRTRHRGSASIRTLAGIGCALMLVAARAPAGEPAARQSEQAGAAGAAESRAGANPDEDVAKLKSKEEQIAAQYKRFEEVLLRMAELTAAEDPQRAMLLRQAVARSKKRLISVQFDRLVELLGQEQLSLALTNQTELSQDLRGLLELLLSEDRAKRLESEQQRIRGYLKELNKLIAEQQAVQSQTRRAEQPPAASIDRQEKLSQRTGKLDHQIEQDEEKADGKQQGEAEPGEATDESGRDDSTDKKSADQKHDPPDEGKHDPERPGSERPKDDGKSDRSGERSADKQADDKQPGEGSRQPAPPQGESAEGQNPDQASSGEQSPKGPTDAARQRLQAAQQRMQQAVQKLKEAQRDAAVERQRQALEELEQAKADLEKILRQLREEELARVLAFLEARFRKMLEDQTQVLEATAHIAALNDAERTRSVELESGRLSRKESQIAVEADKALTLLREDATAVAMPEAVRQLRDDMQQVATRLAEFHVDTLTQGIEEDIVAGLEDILAALEKAKKDLEQKQQNQSPPPSGEPQEPPLVDALAELKVIRALQMRVNRRTETYAKLVEGEQAVSPDILTALEELSQRQERIYRTTRDIAIGRNR